MCSIEREALCTHLVCKEQTGAPKWCIKVAKEKNKKNCDCFAPQLTKSKEATDLAYFIIQAFSWNKEKQKTIFMVFYPVPSPPRSVELLSSMLPREKRLVQPTRLDKELPVSPRCCRLTIGWISANTFTKTLSSLISMMAAIFLCLMSPLNGH